MRASTAATASGASPSPKTSGDSVYFVYGKPVYGKPGWTLKRAVNPSDSDPLMSKVEPSLDWFAEYEQRRDIEPGASWEMRRVRLSGHRASLDALRAELRDFAFETRTVRGRPGMTGRSPERDGRPIVVAFEPEDEFSVMTLSQETPVDELVRWTDDLERVSEKQWADAGGTFASDRPSSP